MSGRIFFVNVLLRTLFIVITALLFVFALSILEREIVFTIIVGSVVVLIQIYLLTLYVNKINRILVNFIDYVDSNKSSDFQLDVSDKIFEKLKKSLNMIHSRVRQSRLEIEKQSVLLDTVVNSIDTGLISYNQVGDIIFINKLAKFITGGKTIKNICQIADAKPELYDAFTRLKPNIPVLFKHIDKNVSKSILDKRQNYSLRLNRVILDSIEHNIISIQNIFEEIEKNELESWQKIIRVLTHEIMNSVGPILSLVSTIKNYFINTDSGKPNRDIEGKIVEKAITGLHSIEVTGKGLIHFVNEYKRLSGLPEPRMEKFAVNELIQHIATLMNTEFVKYNIELSHNILPENLILNADKSQIEQVLINLLKNSIDALKKKDKGKIIIYSDIIDDRTVINIEDNGEGISPDSMDKIFIPFYTSRENGSGIGLSLARQIMKNHDGFIQLSSGKNEKTIFSLHF